MKFILQLKIFVKIFNENNIKFKKFKEIDEDLCFKDEEQQIYFSSVKLKQKLNEEWKFWFYIKILNVLDKKIENSYSLFNEVFNKPNNQNNVILKKKLNKNKG